VSAELIVPPDPVDVVATELNAAFPAVSGYETVRAGGSVPAQRPRQFVRLRAVGGAQDTVVHVTPTVAVESYADTPGDAAQLANVAHAILLTAGRNLRMGGMPCSGVAVFALPQDLPDPTTDQARSTATYAVSLRGAVA
jgi:hypothetical protein